MRTVKRNSSTRRTARPAQWADIDEYLASLPADKRATLKKLRKDIHLAAPRAEEGFSYGLPAFRLKGRPLVCFAVTANHCSFYPMSPAVSRAHADDLKSYETSRGTIRFLTPLPATLVRKLVKSQLAELEPPRPKAAR